MKVNADPLFYASVACAIFSAGMILVSLAQRRSMKNDRTSRVHLLIDDMIKDISLDMGDRRNFTCVMIQRRMGDGYYRLYKKFLMDKFPSMDTDKPIGDMSMTDHEINQLRIVLLSEFKHELKGDL